MPQVDTAEIRRRDMDAFPSRPRHSAPSDSQAGGKRVLFLLPGTENLIQALEDWSRAFGSGRAFTFRRRTHCWRL